ncbi:kinase-like protein [Hymenopellis radicata]|nr:kinase-like protein [Hymenopellis radicata]
MHTPTSSLGLGPELHNRHLFQKDGSIAHNPEAYLQATLKASRSSGRNLAHHSVLTHLVYSKLDEHPQYEYITAHVAPLIDGVAHTELAVEVDLQRFIDPDSQQPANGFGVKLEASHYTEPFRDRMQHPFRFCSPWDAFAPADTIVVHPMSGDPVPRHPLKAQAVMMFLHPEQAPFSFEELASLFYFFTSVIAPSRSLVVDNGYQVSAWIWHAVARLAEGHVEHDLRDLAPMGACGTWRVIDSMRYGQNLRGDDLDRAMKTWNGWERQCETTIFMQFSWRDLYPIDPGNESAVQQLLLQVRAHLNSSSLTVWKTIGEVSPTIAPLIMNFLQSELDAPKTIEPYRSTCIKCLTILGKQHDILPDSFFCRGIQILGSRPVRGGGFADIWMGTMSSGRKPVCLKILRVFTNGSDRTKTFKALCHEALVWRQLRHPNILPFLGVNDDLFAPGFCLVSKWMANGNINEFLMKHPSHDRLQSIIEIAKAFGTCIISILKLFTLIFVVYVFRSFNITGTNLINHREIQGNVLVSDDFRCVLADFGISLMVETQVPASTTLRRGTIRWLPPEMIETSLYQPAYIAARDIYSFGCTVIEIFTVNAPFSHIATDAGVMHEVVVRKRTPPRPSEREFPSSKLWDLVVACLSGNPRDRPSAKTLLKSLYSLVKTTRSVVKIR